MNRPRQGTVPVEHLVAEVAAAPLSSEDAFESCLLQLEPMAGRRGEPNREAATQRLWRWVEGHLLREAPDLSIDKATSLRDLIWFNDPNHRKAPLDLDIYLRSLADLYSHPEGDRARLKISVTSIRDERIQHPITVARRNWRWMTFALPPDLLLAAACLEGAGAPKAHTVSAHLRRHLEAEGFAETHLHLGAGMDFPTLWISTLHAVARDTFRPERFQGPGAIFSEGRDLGHWLLRAVLGRMAIAAYLWQRDLGPRDAKFLDVMSNNLCPQLVQEMGATSEVHFRMGLQELISGILASRDSGYIATLRQLVARGNRILLPDPPQSDEPWLLPDPISGVFPSGPVLFSSEQSLVRRALVVMDQARADRSEDPTFQRLFWQFVRIRCIFYRHVVQRPLIPGLQWFIRTYGRLSAPREPMNYESLIRETVRNCGFTKGLRSLEFRTSPSDKADEILKLVCTTNKIAWDLRDKAKEPDFEIGIAFHLTKRRSREALKGFPTAYWQASEADPSADINPSGYRYSGFYRERRHQAMALAKVLTMFPLSLSIVRAVDVCTDELGVPTWVVAPLIRYMKSAGEIAAEYVRHAFCVEVPSLHTCPHTGEDYVHLMEGMRRMEESIDGLNLSGRDRIGHGVALGEDARQWALRNERVPMQREDRLLDLLWEWRCYATSRKPNEYGRQIFIQHEVGRLARKIFSQDVSMDSLQQLVKDLHDEEALQQVGFPDGPAPAGLDPQSRFGLLLAYLQNVDVFRHGREIEWVPVKDEGEVLANLQASLRERVGALGITVEINPSSNLLIGNLSDLDHHPLWLLKPPKPGQDDSEISVCIGSDDPITFATDLRQEYGRLHDSLILGGLTEEESFRWIEGVRQRGMIARFTRPPKEIEWLNPAVDPPSGPRDRPHEAWDPIRAHSTHNLHRRLEEPP